MADSTFPGKWIFVDAPTTVEFQEVFDRDSTGAIIEDTQKIQSRNVYQFRRRRIEPTAGMGSIVPEPEIGDQIEVRALVAWQGNKSLRAGLIHTGETRIYVCTQDASTGRVGEAWLDRLQVWEMRGPWADYDWPVTEE